MSLVNKEAPQPILNRKAVGLKNWGIKLKNPTRSLKWDSFSKCKYIPHNVQGSYLRERKKSVRLDALFRMVNYGARNTNTMP